MTSALARTYLAWLVAIGATAGSLYFSEVRLFVPCELCWWQRIFMYPLVGVLGVAVFTRDERVWRYALPLAVVGLGTSWYHYLLQRVPSLAPPGVCRGGVPCTVQYIEWAGFVTIPFLAGTAFAVITLLLGWSALAPRRSAGPPPG
jgi:disulfide bond formation protein DsbB